MRNKWIAFAAVIIVSFSVLGFAGSADLSDGAPDPGGGPHH